MTDEQYERLLHLCACNIVTIKRFVRIETISDLGNGKYELAVAYKGYYFYQMVYDGKRIIECVRLLSFVTTK